MQGNPSILALSSRTWLNYTYQNLLHFTPLIFENLDYAWSFSAELCPDGLIGIAGNMLRYGPAMLMPRHTRSSYLHPRIFQITKLGQKLKQETMPLLYTPRKFVSHPDHKLFYLVEADHRTLGADAAQKLLEETVDWGHLIASCTSSDAYPYHQAASGKIIQENVVNLPPEVFGYPKAESGRWASCLRIIDPVQASAHSSRINMHSNGLAKVDFFTPDSIRPQRSCIFPRCCTVLRTRR